MEQLPNERIVYFGDTAHLPYGDKSADAIRFYCLKIVKFLMEQNCKMIVIACNSASSAAAQTLVDFFGSQVPFINVVDPLVKVASAKSFQRIGIIATKATIASGVYEQKLRMLNPEAKLSSLATPMLVPMIEEGFFKNDISEAVLSKYLNNPTFENIECLLLACTHYPLIKREIIDFFNGAVSVFDSTDVVTRDVQAYLEKHELLSDKLIGSHRYYVSDYTNSFAETTRLFSAKPVELELVERWKE